MSAARSAEILRQLEHTGTTDAELLARFVATKDTAAFEELVRRHGSLVLGVCKRVVRNPQDAEDVFQATFLVLAQQAASVRDGARLWSWLYGVAFRIAWRARRAARRRREREVTVAQLPEPPAPDHAPPQSELAPVLDEELAALPTHYREAIVLCDLRGASREDAAVALGVPEGTLSSRLANGRKKLAARLTKRGIALTVAALPGVLADARAGAVPGELIARTCERVTQYTTSGTIPGSLAQLIKGRLTVRKVFVLGLVTLAAITGTVLAARPNSAPSNEMSKAPAAEEKRVVAAPPEAKHATEPDKPKKLTADEVLKQWRPQLKGATDFHQMGGEPTGSGIAAYAFRVEGPTFEDVWTHYAKMCGAKQEYKAKTMLITADSGPKGSFVISDRVYADNGVIKRALSVFMLKTDTYVVTVTFQPDPDGKAIIGSLSAVLR